NRAPSFRPGPVTGSRTPPQVGTPTDSLLARKQKGNQETRSEPVIAIIDHEPLILKGPLVSVSPCPGAAARPARTRPAGVTARCAEPFVPQGKAYAAREGRGCIRDDNDPVSNVVCGTVMGVFCEVGNTRSALRRGASRPRRAPPGRRRRRSRPAPRPSAPPPCAPPVPPPGPPTVPAAHDLDSIGLPAARNR